MLKNNFDTNKEEILVILQCLIPNESFKKKRYK